MKSSCSNKSRVGYLPCFSMYNYAHFPCEKLYCNVSAVNKVKQLMSAFVDNCDPRQLHLDAGIGKGGIEPIRPDTKEGKKWIGLFSVPFQIYRIDYGDTKFKVLFGFSTSDGKRMAYVLAFDMKHETFG